MRWTDRSVRQMMDRVFRRQEDPYEYRTSEYQRMRYQAILDAISDRRWRRCLEIGCAEGALTGRLLEHCDRIAAVDISEVALERARRRVPSERVEWVCANVREWEPVGSFDLLVAADTLSYLKPDRHPRAFSELGRKWRRWLSPDGRAVVCEGFVGDRERQRNERWVKMLQESGFSLDFLQTGPGRPHDQGTNEFLLAILTPLPAGGPG